MSEETKTPEVTAGVPTEAAAKTEVPPRGIVEDSMILLDGIGFYVQSINSDGVIKLKTLSANQVITAPVRNPIKNRPSTRVMFIAPPETVTMAEAVAVITPVEHVCDAKCAEYGHNPDLSDRGGGEGGGKA